MSNLRRIAFCITDLDVGGAERALMRIVTGLRPLGWEPKVWCLSGPGELVQPLIDAGIPVECLRAKSHRPWTAVRQLTKGLREWRPALLQTFLFHANIAGRVSACRAKVPVVVSGLRVAEWDAPWRMRLDRWTQRLVTMNVAVSRGVADFSVEEVGLSRDKLCVIPNGVDLEPYQTATPIDWRTVGLPVNARVITMIGRLHPQKDPDLFIHAAVPLLAEQPDLHVVLVGDGPRRRPLQEQIASKHLSGRVHLLGRRDDIPSILKGSTACVLPSRWEGLPNVVLEAMAAGCPVVATDVEGTRELVEHDVTGRLIPAGATDALTAEIRWVLDHPAAAQQQSKSAQRVVSTRFTWNIVVAEYDQLYRQRLSSGENCG
ncbi:MAG: glycosyltransferase [Planctomycetaceae bacterium]